MLNKELAAQVDVLTKALIKDGKLIEAGFMSYVMVAMHPEAPPDQIRECRLAFFAGAQHLFGSIMGVLDEGMEPTPADEQRMSQIAEELDNFIEQFSKALPTKGSA